mmetsp:Transcript_19008/g.58580  ORF Transcript_19008/g.58580 Transcript_19008/m.58580 type:complete len:251 (-) Transcript_19008:278-1030(-)
MMMKVLALAAAAAAFQMPQTQTATKLSSQVSDYSDPSFCAGLPGVLPPTGAWDPLGLLNGLSEGEMKRYREAETQHGRVAMLAVVGFLVAESWHPLFKDVTGPAIDHLTQVRLEYPAFFEIGAFFIGLLEINRAVTGWVYPSSRRVIATLNEDYYPGDVGFDPLGLKPKDPAAFDEMVTKELQNGRLAMLAAAGFIAQELVNHKPIIETLKLLYLIDQAEFDKVEGIPGPDPLVIDKEIFSGAADTFFGK